MPEAAAAADAAMAALRNPAEWAQCSSCERWRLLPEGAVGGKQLMTVDLCSTSSLLREGQCSAEDPSASVTEGFSLDREVEVSPEGRVVETSYCSSFKGHSRVPRSWARQEPRGRVA